MYNAVSQYSAHLIKHYLGRGEDYYFGIPILDKFKIIVAMK